MQINSVFYLLAALTARGVLVATAAPDLTSPGDQALAVTAPNPIYGLAFDPFVRAGQDPNAGRVVSAAQIRSLLKPLQGRTQWIRTFGMQSGLQNVPAIAHKMGFRTVIGAYIGRNAKVNAAQIANLVAAAKAGNVNVAVVGNEALLNHDVAEAQIIAYIHTVKAQIPDGIPVSYVDTWNTIVAHPNIIAAEDIVMANMYPFFENATIDQALRRLKSDYAKLVQAAGEKPAIISETGWPSSGNPPSTGAASVPSAANQVRYFSEVAAWARTSNTGIFYFEAYDEPWKVNYKDYPSWGIWDAAGHLKTGMDGPFTKN